MRWPFQRLQVSSHNGDGRLPEQIAAEAHAPKPASWEFETGTPIVEGRWALKDLGGGSRYEVYLVWDDRLFALAVAKILRPDQVADTRALRELELEAEILARLAHPVLVRGFDAVLEGPRPHVLIEHLEGPTLRRLIKGHGALPLEQLLPLALHIAAVLQYLSNEQVVHLDVKPGNIVMGVPPRLIDLSIARSFERATQLHHPIGTDPYMSPEQCDPISWPGRIGPAADVWGLGATLYLATSGELPFGRGDPKSRNLAVRFPQLVAEPKPLPRHLPQPLKDLILKMLAKDPLLRPAAAKVAAVLEPLVAPLPWKLTVTRRGIRARAVASVSTAAPL